MDSFKTGTARYGTNQPGDNKQKNVSYAPAGTASVDVLTGMQPDQDFRRDLRKSVSSRRVQALTRIRSMVGICG